MSKKFAKILGGLAVIGEAAAGIFYWYKKKNSEEDFEDEFNEDFEAEEFELDEDLKEVSDRGYTTLTPSSEAEAKEEPISEETGSGEAAPEEASSEDAVPTENAAPSEDAATPEEEPKAE